MPANPLSSTSMQLTSDYPIEKVVYLNSGSFTIPAVTTNNFVSVPHGLPFIPLTGGAWSLASDFSSQFAFSTGVIPSSNPSAIYDQLVGVFADATSIYLISENFSASAKTIYYRIFGLQPTTDDSAVAHTGSQGDPFNLNSSNVMHKVMASGYVDLPATGASEYTVDVAHGMGFVGFGAGWQTYDTYNGITTVEAVHPTDTLFVGGFNANFTTNNSNDSVTFVNQPYFPATRVHYRLYA